MRLRLCVLSVGYCLIRLLVFSLSELRSAVAMYFRQDEMRQKIKMNFIDLTQGNIYSHQLNNCPKILKVDIF